VRLSTSASGSQPSGNTKNDRILQTPSSNSKNKVEAHPRNDFIFKIENKNTKKGNWHYAKDDPMFTTINVILRNEATQLYGAILPVALTNEDIRNSE
ncbi:hypothetical protein Tco_0249973, partial [Tanacetum coccineum]